MCYYRIKERENIVSQRYKKMKEKDTAYYVAAELQGKAEYFKKKIDNEKELIEIHKKFLHLDQERGQKEIFRCECRIEAFQNALEVLERAAEIWGE